MPNENKRLQKLRNAPYGFRSESPISNLLLVCREWHDFAVCHYTRTFGSPCGGLPETYFDFQRDTLYLDERLVLQYEYFSHFRLDFQSKWYIAADLARVEHLAIWWESKPDLQWHWIESVLPNMLRQFTSLRSLSIVGSMQYLDSQLGDVVDHSNLKFVEGLTYKNLGLYVRGHRIFSGHTWVCHKVSDLPRLVSPGRLRGTMCIDLARARHILYDNCPPNFRELHHRVISTPAGVAAMLRDAVEENLQDPVLDPSIQDLEEPLSFYRE